MKFIIYDKSREEYQVPWTGKSLIIGRRADADIQVNEPTLSGVHAQIFAADDEVRIRDLDSLNGTQVNDVRIVETPLRAGDHIKIGRAMIVVSGPSTNEGIGLFASGESVLADNLASMSTQTQKIELDKAGQSWGSSKEHDHIQLLSGLFKALSKVSDAEEVLDQTYKVLTRAYSGARIFIIRPDADGEWQLPDTQDDARAPSLTFAAEAARTASAVLATSMPTDQRFSASESVRISGIETAIAAPLSCDGKAVAVLYVDRLGNPAFNNRDLNILGIAANHVTAVLENVSRFQALSQARENLARLNRDLEQMVRERTAEIQRQSDEIRRLAEAKDELLGIAVHDIRGPLTVIQGTTELLRLRLEDIDRITLTRSLDLMHEASRGLTQLLGELLDAKAIEAGKITLQRRPYPVRRLIEDALPVARLAAEDKRIDLVIESEPNLEIEVDPKRLGQAITNLVLNAVKFSSSGTRILLRGVRHQFNGTRIEVEDQGIGIPEEELEHIFGSFHQGRAGQQLGGSGLGLMVARRIVELHGGTLSVQSRIGVGTRFILSFADGENN